MALFDNLKDKIRKVLTTDDVVARIEKKYTDIKNYMRAYERQWYLNLAFFLGHHWSVWDYSTNRLETPPAPPWRVRMTVNFILTHVRRTIAKMTKSKPILIVLPSTNQDEDKNAAKIGNKVLEFQWRNLKMPQKLEEALTWTHSTGTSWLFPYWDPELGDEILEDVKDENGFPSLDEMGMPMSEKVQLGDIATDVLSPFELLFPGNVRDYREATEAIRVKVRSLDYIKKRYPEKGDQVKAEKSISAANIFERRLMSIVSTASYRSVEETKEENTAIVKEYWEIPTKDNPKGSLITIANGVLLRKSDFPYPFKRLPFVPIIEITIPWRIHGMATAEHIIPMNKEYNRTRSQLIENKNLMSRPKWLLPKGSGVHKTALTSDPGEVVEYNPTLKPESWTPPSIPQYVVQELDRCLLEINEISHQHEVSRAQTPPNVESGVAIQLLQEQDDTYLAPIMRRFEESIQEWGRIVLEIIKDKYTDTRTLKIVGENNKFEFIDFKGADLKDNTDVHCVAGSALPQSKVARQETILRYYQMGLLGEIKDPETRRKTLKLLEFAMLEDVFDEDKLDIEQVNREHVALLEGMPIPPALWFHNHETHIHEHQKLMKTEKFEQAIRANPNIYPQIDGHVMQHTQLLMPAQPQMPLTNTMPTQGGR